METKIPDFVNVTSNIHRASRRNQQAVSRYNTLLTSSLCTVSPEMRLADCMRQYHTPFYSLRINPYNLVQSLRNTSLYQRYLFM